MGINYEYEIYGLPCHIMVPKDVHLSCSARRLFWRGSQEFYSVELRSATNISCRAGNNPFFSNRSSGTVPNGPPKRTIPRTHGKYQQNQFEKVYFSQQYLPLPILPNRWKILIMRQCGYLTMLPPSHKIIPLGDASILIIKGGLLLWK